MTEFNENEITYTLRESNVLINCIGSKSYSRYENEFEDANIRIPVAMAKACKKNPKIKRFIHISAAGADPNS